MDHPHDLHLRRSFQVVRFGMQAVAADPGVRARVLAWIERMKPRFPGSPHLEAWDAILGGRDPEAVAFIEGTRDFFDLPADRRGTWRQLIQSHPFACIVPGRTTRERRQFLSRLS